MLGILLVSSCGGLFLFKVILGLLDRRQGKFLGCCMVVKVCLPFKVMTTFPAVCSFPAHPFTGWCIFPSLSFAAWYC